ncbi:MAG TPA: hypothetical protein VLR52_03280 [Bacteroidales bacterium]|nr:hypothetical protein [Bacteroidales bacterium]
MKRIGFLSLILFVTLCLFLSCKKNTSVDLNPNISSSKDVVLAGIFCQNIFVTLIKARSDSNIMRGVPVMIDSARVTWNSATKTFLFQYGHILCPDSVERIGTIMITTTGDILLQGTRSEISLSFYEEDGNAISFNDTITTSGPGSNGSIQFRFRVDNGRFIKAIAAGTIAFHADYMIDVQQDANIAGGKIISFTGNLSGTSSHGDVFSSEISKPVEFRFSCPWPTGTVTLTVPGADIETGEIRFSPGTDCNNRLLYIIEGHIIPGTKINSALM